MHHAKAMANPYSPGNTLVVQVESSQSCTATIIKTFEPFTLSCVVLVQVDCPLLQLKGEYVLKLFDRRFATQLREDNKVSPWNPQLEDQYLEYYYKAETSAYDKLSHMQGREIPQLLTRGIMTSPPTSDSTSEYLNCPAILLEYLKGSPLTDLAKFAPREVWQDICDEAIRIINGICDHYIRNKDVNTRSFIIRGNPSATEFSVRMIDFGHCVLKGADEGEQDWRKRKAREDEEGAIGVVMQRKLKGGFIYTRSSEAESLSYEFMREEPGD
ncbi:hypothetical protein EJ08DRAFT_677542 [Tothia fuscella]|uniref:Protein kinase domain-containing protein n=1 Tax=Tothia fuscella TaxID=1048955 RepID=A0A9P4NWV6_9PEZI|nr:hypothetical protein EJ08DRAFT_677542 [Tothia fuscella]